MNIPYSPARNPQSDQVTAVVVSVAPLFDFSDWQVIHPTQPLPGVNIDAEFQNGYNTTNLLIARLALIQRDDGGVANSSIGLEQLKPEVLDEIEQDVSAAQGYATAAAASAAQASASEAAAEVSKDDAAASEASAAASEGNAAASATAADASADHVDAVIATLPPLPSTPGFGFVVNPAGTAYVLNRILYLTPAGKYDAGGNQIISVAAPANANDAANKKYVDDAVQGAVGFPPTTIADAGKVITVNPAGDGYELDRALMLAAGGFDATAQKIINLLAPTAAQDAATKKYVDDSVTASGAVPAPIAGDAGKVLSATGVGAFSWQAFLTAMIFDATAYMKGLITTINDAAGFRVAIGAAASSQAVPVPANPADDGKSLKANGGAFSWQTQTNLVPTPANPADDGKALLAVAGAYGWTVIQQVPVPASPADNAKVLTANAGAFGWTAPAVVADATNAVKGIIKIETTAEVAAGVDTASALSIGEFAVSKFTTLGKQTYLLQAGALAAHPTTGPVPQTIAEVNGEIYRVLGYADGVTQSAGIAIPLNKKIDITQAFNVRIRFFASALGNVLWRAAWSTAGDGENNNAVMTTAQLAAPNGVVNQNEITAQIVCAWPAGAAKEETLFLTIQRIGADALDTMLTTAFLMNVEVAFITDKGNDA